jgi:hypothetical protein
MSRERWFRAQDDSHAFDWSGPAGELEVPVDVAHALYVRAVRFAADPARAEALYLRWLRATAESLRAAAATSSAAPGRHTRVSQDSAYADRARGRRDRGSRSPGRTTLVALEASADDAAPPGLHAHDEQALRDRLLAAAAEQGRGVAVELASADPATAAAALRSLRSAHVPGRTTPVLRLVAQAADGAVERVLRRGSVGAALPADQAARLAPHVGGEAAGAARLHTDESADLIAAAHHARALTLGTDIFFARGQYAPGTVQGDELLAHELTHVAQGQRGDLMRAAAKGVESGGPLDRAEVEADLRARFAVLQLHPTEVTVPALAQPAGQPTSPEDRAARIAAQQERIALANQAVAPLAPPVAPPAVIPNVSVEDSPAPSPTPTPTPTPTPAPTPVSADADNAYVDTFEAPPSRQAMELWAQTGAQATLEAAEDQAQFDAALPDMQITLEGSEPPAAAGETADATVTASTADAAVPPAAETTPTPEVPPVTADTVAQTVQPSADQAQMQADAQQAIEALPTTAPDVNTNPGPAPVTELAGQADPMRTVADHQQAITDGIAAVDAAMTSIVTGPGPAQVQPVALDEQLTVPEEQPTGAMPELPAIDGMARFESWNLPADVQASFDDIAQAKMDASLAEAQAQMTAAETQRDAERDLAVADAQDQVRQANADADRQQQARVAETRSWIANQQAATLVAQQTEMQRLDHQSGERRTATMTRINDRITTDQATVDTNFQDAQRRADDRRVQGETEAAQKKQDAQDEAANQSWWDQLIGSICDAIQAIADEINEVLDAIGQAVTQILDEVKTAACQIIDAACQFVCQELTAFGDWLKAEVTALIGTVFPELAAALNDLIDQAVAEATTAVTAIADDLKTAVTELCDGLKAAIDAAIATFKAAVEAAATFATALVTGDWAVVGRMVLDGILTALGIDPAAFYALIGEAEDSIQKIIEDPGAFVGHLVDAVELGFSQFGDNFWTHLQSGMLEWLTGTLGGAGIQMPASFDIAGIFDLVCQVLGLTWPRLREKVVALIGEDNTERLEFVAQYIQALITGGFAGLWEQIQQDLSNLWDMVVGGIRDWLIQNVVQQAILKIATMWNPVGAIFQLIQTAWNAYQWLRENAQRIFGLVEAIVHSISNIVAGDISGAANFVESSLAQLVPVAISLFADLIGLGGIADEVQRIIGDVQDAVDRAIDALIERVKALFRGGDGEADAPDQDDDGPIGTTVTFEAGGEGHAETHRTWIEVEGTTARVMVASTPAEAMVQLGVIEGFGVTTEEQIELFRAAETQVGVTQAAADAAVAARANDEDVTPLELALESEQRILANALKRLFDLYFGDFESWFPYKLNKSERGVIQSQPRPSTFHDGFQARTFAGDMYETAYLANIATAPALADTEAAIVAPARIGSRYAAAFANPADLANRFALVIGVNTFDNLENTAEGEVESNALQGVGSTAFSWGVFGFVWAPAWKDRSGGTASMGAVRTAYDALTPERKAIALAYERRNRTVPMGEIRNEIQSSEHSTHFTEVLQQRAHSVHRQVGDGDVVSLNPAPGRPPYFDRYDALLTRAAADIAARAGGAQGDGPIIASGGYKLALAINVGEGGTEDYRTMLATELDMRVRAAMAAIDPGSVYFPEPNLIIEITSDTINASFVDPKTPELESRKLTQSVIAAMKGRRPTLLWDDDAVMITTAPARMELGDGASMSRLWIEVPQFQPWDLCAMFRTAQSHARQYVWTHQIQAAYRLAPQEALPILARIYDAAFPVSSEHPDSFQPDQGLLPYLAGWNPNEANIRALASQLRRTKLSNLGTGDASGSDAEFVDRITEVAMAAGNAAKDWILEILANKGNV